MSAAFWSELHVRRLLDQGPFQRRRGGWRFGTRRISDAMVERLVAAGIARQSGEYIERTVQQDHAAATK